MCFTLWEGPAPVVCRLGDSSGILPWWGGASVRYHVGGVGTRTSHCGVGIRYCTVWEGGVWNTCVLCAVNRTGHVTVFVGGSGSYTVSYTVHGVLRCGMSRHIHGTLCGVDPAHAHVYNMLSLMCIMIMQSLCLLVRVLNRHSTMQMRPTVGTV